MLHRFFTYLSGEVSFQLEGGLGERFLNSCADSLIMLKCIKATPTGYTMSVPYRHFFKASRLAKKYKCKLTVTKKTGICFLLLPYKHRYGIFAGIAAFALLLVLSQFVVWDIRFFECTPQQESILRHSLYEKGICEGSIVTKKQLEKVREELVIENSQFGWLTLNYIKGRIVIEKTDVTPKPNIFSKNITNIVAAYDGIVRKIDVSGGFLQVCEGQSVAKGDVLVSGLRKDLAGNIQKTHAEGKIYAEIEQTYEYSQSLNFSKALPVNKSKSYYELRAFNMCLPLFSQIKTPPESEQRLFRYPLSVFGFRLPATIYEYEVRQTQLTQINLTQEQAVHIARRKVYDTIYESLPEVQILSASESVEAFENKIVFRLKINAKANISKQIAIE